MNGERREGGGTTPSDPTHLPPSYWLNSLSLQNSPSLIGCNPLSIKPGASVACSPLSLNGIPTVQEAIQPIEPAPRTIPPRLYPRNPTYLLTLLIPPTLRAGFSSLPHPKTVKSHPRSMDLSMVRCPSPIPIPILRAGRQNSGPRGNLAWPINLTRTSLEWSGWVVSLSL